MSIFGYFYKKPNREGKTIRMWMISGGYFDAGISDEILDELVKNLEMGWATTSIIQPKFGMSFSNITHYEILE